MIKPLFLLLASLFIDQLAAQPSPVLRTVQGSYLDTRDNSPLLGGLVRVKHGTQRAVVDARGMYTIQAADTDTLRFTFLGFYPIEIPVEGRAWIDAKPLADTTPLEQIVVVCVPVEDRNPEVMQPVSRVNMALDLRENVLQKTEIMDKKVTFGGKPVTLVGEHRKVGDAAPAFILTDDKLQPVPSEQFSGKVRIYSVFPSVDTSVCSLQNKHFNKEAAALGEHIVVLSISVDLPFAQKRFCAAEGIDRVHVLSDYRNRDFGMKYGFVIEELCLLARGVVVVDQHDVIRYIEYVSEIASEPDYDKALAVARELVK